MNTSMVLFVPLKTKTVSISLKVFFFRDLVNEKYFDYAKNIFVDTAEFFFFKYHHISYYYLKIHIHSKIKFLGLKNSSVSRANVLNCCTNRFVKGAISETTRFAYKIRIVNQIS